MNYNNRHFQIKNFHFHFHRWKHDFTLPLKVFTRRYYTCPKCETALEEILGYSLGRFCTAKTLIDMEQLEVIKKFHVMIEEEKKKNQEQPN